MDDNRPLELPSSLQQLCDPELDGLFWVPERRGSESAWWGHVPFAQWLVPAIKPRLLAELGTHRGVSYAAFCHAVMRCGLDTRCFAVDTWKGDEHSAFYDETVFEDFRAFHDEHHAAFSTILRSTFDEAAVRFAEGSIDLLHIDGLHTYDAVRHDFETWLPKMSSRGVMLLHDIDVHAKDFGVWRLWDELARQYPHFALHHGYGLGVLAVGNEIPAAVALLCKLTGTPQAAALRNRLALIGQRWISHAANSDLRSYLATEKQTHDRQVSELVSLAEARDADGAEARRQLSALEKSRARERADWETQLAKAARAREEAEEARLALEHTLTTTRDELAALLGSTTWRMTYPIRRAATRIPAPIRRLIRGRRMAPELGQQPAIAEGAPQVSRLKRGFELFLQARARARIYGWPATIKRAWQVRAQYAPQILPSSLVPAQLPSARPSSPISAFPELGPLRTYVAPGAAGRRITLVTDSVNAGSLFGGVGTALLLAAAVARRHECELRIITELEPASPSGVATLFRAHGMRYASDIDFVFSDRREHDRRPVDLRADELFLTTSWWSTWNTLQGVAVKQIFYLIQEDERVFYPYGDTRLRANEIMAHPELNFIINSHLLSRHLEEQGFANCLRNGVVFEPAFPKEIYYWQKDRETRDSFNFLFYARPHHPRNLYIRGLEAINAALEKKILDPNRWSFCFVGSNIDNMPTLAGNVTPKILQNIPWHEYSALIRQADLGLCLMYTPLPSYPPLDIAASGGVALTNRCGPKQSLSSYSANILCVDPDLTSLLRGLEAGAALATNLEQRRQNYETAGLQRSWEQALEPAIERITRIIGTST